MRWCVVFAAFVGLAQAQLEDAGGTLNQSWTLDPQFEHDAFTFVRLRPQSHPQWHIDAPESDLNFVFRLHQLTSLRVNPRTRYLDITNPELVNYPFVYLVEPGFAQLSEQEAEILRKYLLNGGFLMLDDFWGEPEWESVQENMKRIFPDRAPVELTIDHPIFHTVFDLKELPQVPAVDVAIRERNTGRFYEKGGSQVHYYGIFDDHDRMMVIICRNTDLGDSWEQEGTNHWYFEEFSEKRGYPLGMNIITYVMTH